jgi:transposase InsO family protein
VLRPFCYVAFQRLLQLFVLAQRRDQFVYSSAITIANSRGASMKCQAAGIRIVRTPIQAPQANGIAERFVRTVRSECLDWLPILNTRHLERVVTVFIDHYNRHRAHRSLNLTPPDRG